MAQAPCQASKADPSPPRPRRFSKLDPSSDTRRLICQVGEPQWSVSNICEIVLQAIENFKTPIVRVTNARISRSNNSRLRGIWKRGGGHLMLFQQANKAAELEERKHSRKDKHCVVRSKLFYLAECFSRSSSTISIYVPDRPWMFVVAARSD